MNQNLQSIKQRFGIIGNDSQLNRALEKALQVAPTDISVMVIGESGVGKEFIPKIIHNNSHRKHKPYIAVNCGAIPEGTIDSELFGHEKGAFTGADKQRKGYFEVADGGTIFLDEVGELPLQTQVRLLRVLESGEFIKVGSSESQKTNVRIVAATNVNLLEAIQKGKFREDLYYRLNTVQIDIPPLRERRSDIYLLFRKFASDFSEKYRIPAVQLAPDAVEYIEQYTWRGNIRQLRNLVEQLTVVEHSREITAQQLQQYIPLQQHTQSLVKFQASNNPQADFSTEREILYKVLFDMKQDLNDLKQLTLSIIQNKDSNQLSSKEQYWMKKVYENSDDTKENSIILMNEPEMPAQYSQNSDTFEEYEYEEINEPSEILSLQHKEKEFISKALEKYKGRRKKAAEELGISERTLYRKIKQYDLE